MYTIIICAIIGLIIGLLIRDCQVMLTILGGMVGVLIALFVRMGITYDMETYKETYEIVSLNDNSGLSGWYISDVIWNI